MLGRQRSGSRGPYWEKNRPHKSQSEHAVEEDTGPQKNKIWYQLPFADFAELAFRGGAGTKEE